MGVGGFMNGLPHQIIFSGQDVQNHARIFRPIFYLKNHMIAHRDGIGNFQALNLEFPFQAALPQVSILIPHIIPRTRGTHH